MVATLCKGNNGKNIKRRRRDEMEGGLRNPESSSKHGGSGGIENAEVDLRLRWFEHVKGRPQSAPVRRMEAMLVEGLRRRSRPKLRWEDRLKQDMK
ncbi:hypothetical protein Tco_1513349 [Tanacetum coccineum]